MDIFQINKIKSSRNIKKSWALFYWLGTKIKKNNIIYEEGIIDGRIN